MKGKKNSSLGANLYTVVSLFIEKWSCWCHAYFNARALKCHFEALSFGYFWPIMWKNIGWGKVTVQQIVVITAYCTRLLHEKNSLNTVLGCQDQTRCSFAENITKVCFMFLCIVLFGTQWFLSAHPWRWSQLGNRNLRIKLCGNDNDSSLNFQFDPQLHPWSFAVHMYYVISLLTSTITLVFLGCIGFGLHIWSLKMWCWESSLHRTKKCKSYKKSFLIKRIIMLD